MHATVPQPSSRLYHTTGCRAAVHVPYKTRRLAAGFRSSRHQPCRVVRAVEDQHEKKTSPSETEPAKASPATQELNQDELVQLPKEVIQRLRDVVFGFDTFHVTSVENYQANGVMFKGNLRGRTPAESYARTLKRFQTVMGDAYQLYFLQDKQDNTIAVVLPTNAIQNVTPIWQENALAAVFAVATIATTLSVNGLQFLDPTIPVELSQKNLFAALPGTLAFLAILGAHEGGHWWAARRHRVKLSWPFFIPSGLGFLGSFGTITRFKSAIPNRQVLLEISAAGPAAGAAVSLLFLVLGLALTAVGVGGVPVLPEAFEDSLLVGLVGKLFLWGKLSGKDLINLNPLAIAGWAGLSVTALNTIPIGEIDGGRIAFALWGRQAASRIGVVSTVLLGFGGIIEDTALYWVLLVLFLQRGPLVPQQEELSAPDKQLTPLGIGLLFLPILVLLPAPIDLTGSLASIVPQLVAEAE